VSSTMDDLRRFIGRTVKDSYGKSLGRLVGVTSDIKGCVDSISVELGHGEFENFPTRQVSTNGVTLIVHQEWSVEADELTKELDLLRRRDHALDELYSSGDIEEAAYKRLKEEYRKAREDLLNRAEATIKKLADRSQRLDEQTKLIQSIMANNKMQYTSGEIGEEEYCLANEAIQEGLNRFSSERKNIDDKISSLISMRDSAEDVGEPKPETKPQQTSEQTFGLTKTGGPRDIVIVRMEP